MTERKPPEIAFESWVDRQIREAAERGEFDNLPGTGKPLDLGGPDDENWWVRGYLRREGLSTEELLPTPLRLLKEIEQLPETVRDLPSEPAVRDTVDALNVRIVEWLRHPSGPRLRVGRVDPDHVVAQWREHRAAAAEPAAEDRTEDPDPGRRRGWWRRFTDRRAAS